MRYYLGAAHYRSTIEYHEGSLREAEAAVDRIEGFLRRAAAAVDLPGADLGASARALPAEFVEAMDDDLNVSGALAVIHETVRAGNTALDEGDDEVARDAALLVVDMTDVLGVNPLAAQWHAELGQLGRRRAQRARRPRRARSSTRARPPARPGTSRPRTPSATSSTAAGIAVEDTASGARWSLARRTEAVDVIDATDAIDA